MWMCSIKKTPTYQKSEGHVRTLLEMQYLINDFSLGLPMTMNADHWGKSNCMPIKWQPWTFIRFVSKQQ